YRLGRVAVAVEEDKPAPVGPVLLRGGEGVESPGVHVVEVVGRLEVPKVTAEPLPAVGEPRGGGKPGPRAHQHRVRLLQGGGQALKLCPGAPGKSGGLCLYTH